MIDTASASAGLDFELPAELVAQRPLAVRDQCRLLCTARGAPGTWTERRFDALPSLLRPGDLLVRNVSRVLPARLLGRRESGGAAEVLLLEPADDGAWWAWVRPGRRLNAGVRLCVAGIDLEVRAVATDGRRLVVAPGHDLRDVAERHGHMPLPPYVDRAADERDRDEYQTVYARVDGSVAAPTAGLHFTPDLLSRVAAAGVRSADVVLHVGVGTFAPIRAEDPTQHVMHWERFEIASDALAALDATRAAGGRIVAVGTTVVRALESLARWRAGTAGDAVELEADAAGVRGRTRLFLHPPHRLGAIDAMVTNFHLPRSSLLLLVQAFAGVETMQRAYAHAIAARFRFYSYGDAMWIA